MQEVLPQGAQGISLRDTKICKGLFDFNLKSCFTTGGFTTRETKIKQGTQGFLKIKWQIRIWNRF